MKKFNNRWLAKILRNRHSNSLLVRILWGSRASLPRMCYPSMQIISSWKQLKPQKSGESFLPSPLTPSPYPSPYTHRNNSPSKLYVQEAWGAGRPLLERDILGSRGQDGRSPPEPTPKPGSCLAREEPCSIWATVGSPAERSRRETLDVEYASVIAPAFRAQNCGQL